MAHPSENLVHAQIDSPLQVGDGDALRWDHVADVVVVGYGGAGICAALEARENGADVAVIDRFDGGGATAISGGVIYAGGTRYQKEAGIEDSVEETYKYLQLETRGIVSDATLRRFCEAGQDNLDWLTRHGASFSGTLCTAKTQYPGDGQFLYYSGNEVSGKYAEHAIPAPRGHRTVGKGMTGNVLYAALRGAADKAGIKLYAHSPVKRLVIDSSGAVIGVELRSLPEGSVARREHRFWYKIFITSGLRLFPTGLSTLLKCRLDALERKRSRSLMIRAKTGVILSTGGFIHNREMVLRFAPNHKIYGCVGTAGCMGSGILLGESAGGHTSQMGEFDIGRSISPPTAYVKGVVVNGQGRRFIAEDCYMATLGREIATNQNGSAWIVLDRALYEEAFKYWRAFNVNTLLLYWLAGILGLLLKSKKGKTVADLARVCSMPAGSLEATLREYAPVAAGELEDPLGKSKNNLHVFGEGPYHAVDISVRNAISRAGSFSLGGLVVNEETGQVLRRDGTGIPGLYAAGRTAVGIPSNHYVSGLSLGDCVFSGRRAGRAAALSARSTQSRTPHFA